MRQIQVDVHSKPRFKSRLGTGLNGTIVAISIYYYLTTIDQLTTPPTAHQLQFQICAGRNPVSTLLVAMITTFHYKNTILVSLHLCFSSVKNKVLLSD